LNDDIIFERDEDLSEDEEQMVVKKLGYPLTAFKINSHSILFLTAAYIGDEETEQIFDI